jgi:anti-anti-sigma factor
MVPSQPNSRASVSAGRQTATVSVHGDFDMAGAFTIEPALEAALREPGLRAITLDLSASSFIDSTGLSVIVELAAEARASGVALAIVPGPEHVQRVFQVAGLSDSLPFVAPEPQ